MAAPTSKLRHYKAKIVPNVLRVKTFQGRPRNDYEKFQVCEKDVADMTPKMAGLPLCYAHNRNDVVGKVLASYRNPVDNAWEVKYEVDGSTKKGADMIDWIDKGRMRGVSLNHVFGKNEPLEVSVCWRGMREGSETYESVAASYKHLLHYDSNSDRYTQEPDPGAPIHVAASADGSDDTPDLCILEICDMSADSPLPTPPVVEMEVSPPPPAAAAAAPPAADAQASAEDKFKRFNDAKNVLTYSNGILKKTDKEGILESIGLLELEKAKEKDRADKLEAELKAFRDQAAKEREEGEAKIRKEVEDEIAATKQKMGDFIEAHCDQPGIKENLIKAMSTMDRTQLASLDMVVKAQFRPPQPIHTHAENLIGQYMRQPAYAPSHPQRTPAAAAPAAAAAAAAPSPYMTVAASRGGGATHRERVYGARHERPYAPQITVQASYKGRDPKNFMRGKQYMPAHEFDPECNPELQVMGSWESGCGGNVHLAGSAMTQEVALAYERDVADLTPMGDGMLPGRRIDRLTLSNIFQDKGAMQQASENYNANKPAGRTGYANEREIEMGY